uniref:Uncharacterized protein n=1 Tax=Oryza barthii TaxID=65489 RepID=A0A0D3FJV8_9ORYZ
MRSTLVSSFLDLFAILFGLCLFLANCRLTSPSSDCLSDLIVFFFFFFWHCINVRTLHN